MLTTGSRSKPTPRKRFGSRAVSDAARLRAIRRGRHSHGYARRVSSSVRKPEPSQCGQASTALVVVVGDVGHEARVVLLERQLDGPEPAVAVLGDDQVRDPLALGLLVVVLVAVDEHHQVGVLLDRARLAQVAQHRALVGPLLDAAVELRQRDHRHLELARERLEAAAYLPDLLDPVLHVPGRAHQLQIVDQDQAQPVRVLLREPSGLRSHVQHGQVGAVVDIQARLREPVRRLQDLPPARLRNLALAQVVALDGGLARDEALRELPLGHLEAEQRDGFARVQRGVLREVGHQRRLAHRRPCGEDDQVAGLEAAGERVEVLEAGRRADDRRALERELLQLVQLGVQQLLDRAEVLARVLVGDLEDRSLRHVDQLARAGLVAMDLRLDLVRGVQEPAQHRVLAHDARVLADVADRGDRAGQELDRRRAADRLQLAGLLEVLDQRQRVDRLADRVQVQHRLVDAAVRLAIEVAGLQALVDDQRRERGVRQQDGAEYGLLGLEVLRRGDRAEAVRVSAGLGRRAHRAVESRSPTGSNVRSSRLLRALTKKRRATRRFGVSYGGRADGYFCSTTIVLMVAVTPSSTSTSTMRVPTVRIGSSRWTLRRSISMPRASLIASTMSCAVTEPNRRPSSPAWWAIVSTVRLSTAAESWARWFACAAARSLAWSARAAAAIAPLVAGSASLRGIR